MTKLMLDSHEQAMIQKLEDHKTAHGKEVDELKRQLQAIAEERVVRGGDGAPPAAASSDISSQRELLLNLSQQMSTLRSELSALRGEVEVLKESAQHHSSKAEQADPAAPPNSEYSALRARVEEVYCELSEECNALRTLTEQSAVRAGFLAVAASECAPEEKAWLFSKLKAREEALTNQNLTPRTREISRTSRANPSKGLEGITDPIVPGQFRVEINRSSGGTLGVSVDGSDGQSLLVEEIDEGGVMMEWNKRNPDLAVKPGYRIIEVNGKRGNSEELAEEAATTIILHILVQRPVILQDFQYEDNLV